MIFHKKKSQMCHDGLITVLKLNTSYKFIQFSQLNKSLEKKTVELFLQHCKWKHKWPYLELYEK